MSNYLKKLLFTLLILAVPYMNSAPKAMDDEDYEGSNVGIHKISLMTDDQKDVLSSVKNSTSSRVESLEYSQDSWASYLLSPVKSIVYGAYATTDFAIKNPKIAMFVGLSISTQVVMAASSSGGMCAFFGSSVTCRGTPICTTMVDTYYHPYSCTRPPQLWCQNTICGGINNTSSYTPF